MKEKLKILLAEYPIRTGGTVFIPRTPAMVYSYLKSLYKYPLFIII